MTSHREPLRIGVIGAGANTRLRHIPGFQALPDVRVVTVCNRSEASSRRVAEAFGIPRVSATPEALIADPEVDAVCIGTWPYRHRQYAVAALEAGKHVLTEARLAMDAAEAREMLAVARRHPELVAQVVPSPVDLRWWQTIRRMIADGALGAVREVHVNLLSGSALDVSTPAHWREQRAYSGTNTMTLGLWIEAVHRWLGPTRRVIADGALWVTERRDADTGAMVALDVPDSLGVLALMESGARVDYRVSNVTHAPANRTGASIYGTRGTLHLVGDDLTFAPVGGEAHALTPDPGTDVGWRVEADFVDAIRLGAPVRLTNFEDGLAYMRVTDAVTRSRIEGRAVAVDEV